MYTFRKFKKSIYSQDILYNLGHAGGPQLACANVQIIVEELKIYVVLQPKSAHSIINTAQWILPVVQKRIFDELKIDMWLNAEVYSYMEFTNSPIKNDIHVEKIIFEINKPNPKVFLESWHVEFEHCNEMPQFLKGGTL